MHVATTLCRAQIGLHAPLVQVEVHLASGLPLFAIVGVGERLLIPWSSRERDEVMGATGM